MSTINQDGMVLDPKVILKRFLHIEHGALSAVRAVVVHQTDSSTALQTFNSYDSASDGAHFLIDTTGQIYQTASVHRRCYHVGRLIKSKCLTLDRSTCNGPAMAAILAMSWTGQINALNAHERAKSSGGNGGSADRR